MTRGTAGGRRLADPPTRDTATKRTARTLDDVAALSGVSRATVSRVINGGPASVAAQRRVRAVLADVDFRPNAAARTLVSGRSGVVGVVLHVEAHLLFSDPYFAQVLAGIGDQLAGQGTGLPRRRVPWKRSESAACGCPRMAALIWKDLSRWCRV
jgi:hypothetical protein